MEQKQNNCVSLVIVFSVEDSINFIKSQNGFQAL